VLVDGKERGARIDPRAGVVVLYAVAEQRQRGMRVATEHALAFTNARIMDRSPRNFVGEQQPTCVQAIQKARETFGTRIDFLDFQKDPLSQTAEPSILFDEAVELVPMHGEMTLTLILPHVTLVDRNTDQVGHQVRETSIMIALHPDHFDLTLRIGKLANIRQKLPVLAGEAAKIEIGKNIAQQHQAPIAMRLQHVERILRPAQFGPKMNVRQDQRVVRVAIHALVMRHFSALYDERQMKNW